MSIGQRIEISFLRLVGIREYLLDASNEGAGIFGETSFQAENRELILDFGQRLQLSHSIESRRLDIRNCPSNFLQYLATAPPKLKYKQASGGG